MLSSIRSSDSTVSARPAMGGARRPRTAPAAADRPLGALDKLAQALRSDRASPADRESGAFEKLKAAFAAEPGAASRSAAGDHGGTVHAELAAYAGHRPASSRGMILDMLV